MDGGEAARLVDGERRSSLLRRRRGPAAGVEKVRGLAWKLRREEAELVVGLVDDGDGRRRGLVVEVEFAAEKIERRGKPSIPVEGCSIRAGNGLGS